MPVVVFCAKKMRLAVIDTTCVIFTGRRSEDEGTKDAHLPRRGPGRQPPPPHPGHPLQNRLPRLHPQHESVEQQGIYIAVAGYLLFPKSKMDIPISNSDSGR